jgi:hypothetical protein
VSNSMEIVPGKLRAALQIPYRMGGAMRAPVFFAVSSAMYSGCMLSVPRGRWSPCSSTLPTGSIITVPFAEACCASFVLSSSSQRQLLFASGFVFAMKAIQISLFLCFLAGSLLQRIAKANKKHFGQIRERGQELRSAKIEFEGLPKPDAVLNLKQI